MISPYESALESFQSSKVFTLFPQLRVGVLHRTTVQGYRGIHEKEYIFPNTDERFPFSYPQTRANYGYSKGYISLFDFESATYEECVLEHYNWASFFERPRNGESAIIVLKLNRSRLKDKLIPSSAAPMRGEEGYKRKISYVEVWYPEPIPLSIIDSYLVIAPGGSQDDGSLEFKEFPTNGPETLVSVTRQVDEWLRAHGAEV